MIDPDELEKSALGHALKFVAELMGEIGWEKRLNELSAEDAEALVRSSVDGFQEAMRASADRPDQDVPF